MCVCYDLPKSTECKFLRNHVSYLHNRLVLWLSTIHSMGSMVGWFQKEKL